MRVLKIAVGLLVVAVAALIAAVWSGIPANFLIKTIEQHASAEIGYRVVVSGGARIDFRPSLSLTLRDVVLLDEGDRGRNRVAVERVRIGVAAASLLSGQPRVTEVGIVRPVIRVPLVRNPPPQPVRPASRAADDDAPDDPLDLDRLLFVVDDGTVIFVSERDNIDTRIQRISVAGLLSVPEERLELSATGHLDAQILGLAIKAKIPGGRIGGQRLPLEFSFEAPGLLQDALSGTAEVRSKGSSLAINGMTGTIGQNRFSGWATAELAGRPNVKLDVDFQRLDIAAAQRMGLDDSTQPASIDRPWSAEEFNLAGLNFIDADIKLSAAQFQFDKLQFAPIQLAATLNRGILNAGVTRTQAYGGSIQGTLALDVSGVQPAMALRVDLTDVRALPLLSDLAGFTHLNSRMTARIDARGRGNSERAIMSSLTGAIDLQFRDGEIRNINVASMIRTLMAKTMIGWQETRTDKTDLSQLGAFFRLENGRATTDNLQLVGPLVRVTGAGSADIGRKLMQFKLDPKLVMSLEGQGSAANPLGFGVPIVVDGPWGGPRIYPDMAGILDNPEGAYAKLRELGGGLFGGGGQGSQAGIGSILPGIGSLIDRLGSLGSPSSSAPPPPTQQHTMREPAPAYRSAPLAEPPPATEPQAAPPPQPASPSPQAAPPHQAAPPAPLPPIHAAPTPSPPPAPPAARAAPPLPVQQARPQQQPAQQQRPRERVEISRETQQQIMNFLREMLPPQ